MCYAKVLTLIRWVPTGYCMSYLVIHFPENDKISPKPHSEPSKSKDNQLKDRYGITDSSRIVAIQWGRWIVQEGGGYQITRSVLLHGIAFILLKSAEFEVQMVPNWNQHDTCSWHHFCSAMLWYAVTVWTKPTPNIYEHTEQATEVQLDAIIS